MEELKLLQFTKKYENLMQTCKSKLSEMEHQLNISINMEPFEEVTINTEGMVNIVFVGQYSAGKSSIIKMLTKNEGIEVGAAITTQNYTPYEWNGMYIVDTPGIQTGIREDHDTITAEAIQKADLIVFVVTNELFNPTILNYFHKLAYDMGKAGQMLLVVNKMARGGETSVLLDDLRKVLRQPYKDYTMMSADDFSPSFIDAESYLDSLTEEDKEMQEELLKVSHYDDFVETLNQFSETRGLYGKLAHQVQNLQEALNIIYDDIDSLGNQDTQFDDINDTLFLLKEMKRTEVRNLKSMYYNTKQMIRSEGTNVYFSLGSATSNDEANQMIINAQQNVEGYLHDLENSREEIIEGIESKLNKLNKQLTLQLNEVKTIAKSGNLVPLKNSSSNPEMIENLVNTALDKIGSDAFTGMVTGFAKKYIYNGFFDKVCFWSRGAKAAAFAGKVIPVISAVVQVLGAFIEKNEEDKRRLEFDQERMKVLKYFENIGNDAYNQGIKMDVEAIESDLDKYINELEKTLFGNKKDENTCDEARQEISTLYSRCTSLLSELNSL